MSDTCNAIKVIIVEDEDDLREQTVSYLSNSGFSVSSARCAAELYRLLAVEQFSVVILDLCLPDEDGLSIAVHLRSQRNMGIVVTSARGAVSDRIVGLDAGVDVYLPKPINFAELSAVIRNLARRVQGEGASSSILENGWILDRQKFSLTAPNGLSIRITPHEVAILHHLKQCNSVAATRADLLNVLGYSAENPNNRNVDAAIRRLRLKAEDQAQTALPIRTIHSVGYVFEGVLLGN